jgi:dipeptidyl-peptidase-3
MAKYAERLNDIVILHLNTEGFDNLSEQQKKLAFHLSKAGLWGRGIALEQLSQYNVPFLNALVDLYEHVPQEHLLHQQLKQSLFILFTHNGIYHSTSGEKLDLPLQQSFLEDFKKSHPTLVSTIEEIWFSNKVPQFKTLQTDGIDVVQESGGNFYNNITTKEVLEYRKNTYPKISNDEVPPFGFNQRIIKDCNGKIFGETICENGLYAKYITQIVHHLTQALDFAENNEQFESIKTLISAYQTGDAVDFDKHCVAWSQDKDSDIYYINGLIESYDDPLGIGCTFESVVAFKNPLQTAKVNKIIDNIQWFEDNLPFDKIFKKDKAVGLSASSINVISMAGRTAPSLPLGINLPNSDWIRKKHGSKSVNLANVSSGRSTYEVPLREALYLPKYQTSLEKYSVLTNNLHTDLHEIAGHGSGKTLDGVNTDTLGVFYSVIEEARADLIALYFIADPTIQSFGIIDKEVDMEQASLAQYVSYITNGAFAQLRRVSLGSDLKQAHFRNRQLIANWLLDNCDESKLCLTTSNGETFVEINDVQYVKSQIGKLLSHVQEIKSTGNFEAAKNLVMTYGTQVDQNLHKEILNRIEKLDMPKVTGFITPELISKDNTIIIEQPTDFLLQQLTLYKETHIDNPHIKDPDINSKKSSKIKI